ncbi:MAG: DUF885 domain-containing protein [Candidatus Eremiobacteraeota bacterium]|nr:DUF885 domain-containing protein [Candidatus Eremiobacteraeota bacterium]
MISMISSWVRLGAAALTILLCTTLTPMAADSGDAQYDGIAAAYFNAGFKTQPSTATQVGLHSYDYRLDDMSAAAFRARLALDEQYLAKLNALDTATLSADTALDRTLLINAIKDDQLLTGTLAQWKHNPDIYTSTASGAVFSLVSRDFAPLDVRMNDVISRERAIPGLFAQAKANTTSVDSATKLIAYQDALGAVDFFMTTVPSAFSSVKDAKLQAALKSTTFASTAAVKSYAAWIKRLKPSGSFAIGSDAYRKRLEYEDALAMPLPQYLAVGQRALDDSRAQFIAAAKRIDPKATPMQVYLSLAKDHPTASGLLGAAAGDLVRLRAFIVAHHIVSLPPDADIQVVETPAFERTTLSAAMDPPGPLEQVATKAYYYVTPVDLHASKKQQDEFLGEFNNYERPIISAHEVYPGHFVNFAVDRHLNLSLSRKLLSSSEYAEGWAHYSEQMMVDQGWGNGDPRVRLAQLDEALLRECRYVVGVKMHTQGMTVPQAEKLFTGECFQTPQVAVEESLRGTQDPMYGYYTLGKLMVLKLRADYKKKLGSDYTLEKFHDAFLSRGDPPIPLLRPFLLGKDDDGRPL